MKNKLLTTIALSAIFAMTGIASANLLINGDFESSIALTDTNGAPTGLFESADWEQWGWNNGVSYITVDTWKDWSFVSPTNGGNGTKLLNTGNAWYDGGGGAFQTVAATAGQEYQLTVDSGAVDWWLPTGQMELIWLDSTNGLIGANSRYTVDPAVYGDNYDIAHPMENYSLTAVAPVGAEFVKVEFSSRMPGGIGGSITFDNANLEVVPEPATLGLLGLAGGALLIIRRRFKV
jgi:hypothetical protein